jgi:aryl-alcohol dehydrogenase-like predicted oxidoreductase
MVKLALDRGINFIDAADVHSLGESETQVAGAASAFPSERRSKRARLNAA